MTAEAEKLRDTIVAAVSSKMGVSVSDIINLRSRSRQVQDARQVAMWVVREALEQSDLPEDINVANLFGVRMETADDQCISLWETADLFALAQGILYEYLKLTT